MNDGPVTQKEMREEIERLSAELKTAQEKIAWYERKIEELSLPERICPPDSDNFCDEVNDCPGCWARFWGE